VRREVARGVAWTGIATALVAVCDLIAFLVILGRWVTAEELGLVTLAVTVLGAIQLAVEAGLPAAVVQRPDDEDRLSTIYWLLLAFGAAAYAVVWLAAPLLGRAYDRPIVVDLCRVVGLVLVIRPLYLTHAAVLRAHRRLDELAKVRIAANVVELAVKLGTAAWLGLWCFAIAPVARELVYGLGVPRRLAWRPRRTLDRRRVAGDFRFGLRVSAGELLFQLYSNADYWVVGAFFGPTAVGLYRIAYEFIVEPVRFVSGVVTTAAQPAFAALAATRSAVVDQLVAFTRQNLAVVLLFVGVIVISADDLLYLLVGPEYVTAATATRILAVVGVLRAMSLLGPPLLVGLGRPDRALRYHVIAALALGCSYLVCGALGTSYVSIAVAWAIGYPLAFGALALMVLAQLELRAVAYLRAIAGVVAVVVGATAAGLVVRLAAGGLDPLPRLAASSGTVVALGMTLLALVEGYTPRAFARAFRR
jgi:O-antigen/teichoic acid export membrane protein